MNIVQLLISLSILVFIHELGHFFFARLFATRVEKFYLFFNPWFSIFKWKSPRSGTIYGLGWLPLGGYCQIAGMVDESIDAEQLKSEPKADEFRSKTTWQRLLIMAGGIIFNLLLAFFIYSMVAFVWGDKRLDSSKAVHGWSFSSVAHEVGFSDGDILYSIDGKTHLNALDAKIWEEVLNAKEVDVLRNGSHQHVSIPIPKDLVQRILASGEGFAHLNVPFVLGDIHNNKLKELGVSVGDRVIAVNQRETPYIQDVLLALNENKGKSIELKLERNGTSYKCGVLLSDEGTLGVQLRSPLEIYEVEQLHYSLLSAIPAGLDKAFKTLSSYVSSLKHIFTKEGAKSLGGLGTMAKLFPEKFSWQDFWLTTAFLSIILAVMNLLPIPALDGGHIVFILVEMLTGRKPSDKIMGYIQMSGMLLLLLLMLYANGNDIYRYLIK